MIKLGIFERAKNLKRIESSKYLMLLVLKGTIVFKFFNLDDKINFKETRRNCSQERSNWQISNEKKYTHADRKIKRKLVI